METSRRSLCTCNPCQWNNNNGLITYRSAQRIFEQKFTCSCIECRVYIDSSFPHYASAERRRKDQERSDFLSLMSRTPASHQQTVFTQANGPTDIQQADLVQPVLIPGEFIIINNEAEVETETPDQFNYLEIINSAFFDNTSTPAAPNQAELQSAQPPNLVHSAVTPSLAYSAPDRNQPSPVRQQSLYSRPARSATTTCSNKNFIPPSMEAALDLYPSIAWNVATLIESGNFGTISVQTPAGTQVDITSLKAHAASIKQPSTRRRHKQ